jgi:PAS domain S-box-containing protein
MDTPGIRILIVEDEAGHSEAIRRALEAAGAGVGIRVVRTLREYYESVAVAAPDVALMDLNLPDGRAVEALTSPPEAGAFPVLIMTSYGDEHTAVEAMKAGALDYVAKSPEAFRDMPRTLAGALREWKLLQERRHAEEKYRSVVENAAEAICVAQDGKLVFLNAATSAISGYSAQELMARPFIEFVHPDDRDMVADRHIRRMKGEELPLKYALRIAHPSGARWVELHAVAITWNDRLATLNFLSDITERKGAEEALRASEEKYQRLVEDASVGICTTDIAGEITFVNQALCKELGYAAEEMLGRPFMEFVHEEDQQRIAESSLAGFTDPQGRIEFEFRARRKDGGAVDVHTSVTHLKQAENSTGFLAVITNVTERKRAEEALRESETRFRGLFEQTPVSLWEEDFSLVKLRIDQLRASGITDLRAYYREHPEEVAQCAAMVKVVDVNQATLRLYGASSKEELLAGLDKTFGEESYQAFAEQLAALAEGIIVHGAEAVTRTLAGEEIRGILKWILFPGCEETLARVLVSITDITQRKRAEEALRALSARQEAILAAVPDIIVEVDQNKVMTWLNAAGREFYGEDVVGKEAAYYFEGEQDTYQAVQAIFDGDERVVQVESWQRRKDGQKRLLAWWCRVLKDASGQVKGALSSARDITDLRRAEQERLEMERRLLQSQKLESLGVLAGGIAHDFNNLLMALLGNLELATEALSPLSSARPRVEQAVLAAKRAADLTRQMLAYSGKGRFVVLPVNLSELVEENAHMLRAAIPHSITFNLHLGKDLLPILADAGQVQQVVMNLITNAAEASGEGPGIVALATGVQACDADYLSRSLLEDKPAPGRFVWLEVTDTGCGMDEETLQRMFEPFFTTKFTGRGLGMSAVHGIVRGHHGAILIDSQVGKGTTIRVLFPAAERPAGQPAEATAAGGEPAREAAAALLSGTLLVVDDEPLVRELYAATLASSGLQVLTAADGLEAVALFAAHADEIVCVLLDLTMPRMDGVATLEALRQIKPDVRVILCSGYDEQEATQRFAGQGVAGFLHKPYELKSLRAELQRVLEDAG